MTGNCSASKRVLANSLRVVSAKRGNQWMPLLITSVKFRWSKLMQQIVNFEQENYTSVWFEPFNFNISLRAKTEPLFRAMLPLKSWMSCLLSWPEGILSIMIHTARTVLALLNTLGIWWYCMTRNIGLEAMWVLIFSKFYVYVANRDWEYQWLARILMLIFSVKNYCFDSWLFVVSFHPLYFFWMNFSVT